MAITGVNYGKKSKGKKDVFSLKFALFEFITVSTYYLWD